MFNIKFSCQWCCSFLHHAIQGKNIRAIERHEPLPTRQTLWTLLDYVWAVGDLAAQRHVIWHCCPSPLLHPTSFSLSSFLWLSLFLPGINMSDYNTLECPHLTQAVVYKLYFDTMNIHPFPPLPLSSTGQRTSWDHSTGEFGGPRVGRREEKCKCSLHNSSLPPKPFPLGTRLVFPAQQ